MRKKTMKGANTNILNGITSPQAHFRKPMV